MKIRWSMVPLALAIALGSSEMAFGQPIVISSASLPVQVNGTSGGNQKDGSCAGYIAATPNHVIQVTEDSDLRFNLQGAGGQPALLIRGSTGQNFCVPADSYSDGKIEIPGRWPKGTYSVYIGDRANGHYSYTLSISQNQ